MKTAVYYNRPVTPDQIQSNICVAASYDIQHLYNKAPGEEGEGVKVNPVKREEDGDPLQNFQKRMEQMENRLFELEKEISDIKKENSDIKKENTGLKKEIFELKEWKERAETEFEIIKRERREGARRTSEKFK
eukprot:gb/GECH01009862.1/.p1 GENE.gb/GECH01009862.1/~~gb/GECH01009862.1/.p1  ORF type:complete len:133 (+),score=23.22 gb/GECH01009862.1/:1-399(+)